MSGGVLRVTCSVAAAGDKRLAAFSGLTLGRLQFILLRTRRIYLLKYEQPTSLLFKTLKAFETTHEKSACVGRPRPAGSATCGLEPGSLLLGLCPSALLSPAILEWAVLLSPPRPG